jgi:isopenicillin N synthase-like dioxygenase
VIPTVDLGAFTDGSASERQAIADVVDSTCRRIGFLVIERHGVPHTVIDKAWNAARAFFDLPLEDKLATRSADPACPRGYFPIEEETLAKTRGEASAPDPKEAFSSGPPKAPAGHEHADDFDFFYGENLWPTARPGFEAAWLDYYRAMESLGANIMTLLALALNLDEDFFAPYHDHHISALRGINYPEMPATEGSSRAGAHSDYGSVTILKADPDVGGLEVKTPDGDWIRAPSVKDGFIVNIGDLMAHWTNDRWVSTLHRVVAPDEDPVPRRQSIAYFMNPNYDAEISVLPNCGERRDTVTAGQYLIDKFRSAF